MSEYVLIIIWLLIMKIVVQMKGVYRQEYVLGRTEVRLKPVFAIVIFLPIIIMTGLRENIGDTGLYRKGFLELSIHLSELPSYISSINKDKGFAALQILLKEIIGNNDILFFLIIAVVQGGILIYIYRKYSISYITSIFLFIASTDYISWMFNGMRQFLAVTLIFACSKFLFSKKYLPLIIVVLISSTIHASALIMLPVLFVVQGKVWNKKTVAFIVLILFIILGIEKFTSFFNLLLSETQYSTIMTDEIWSIDDGTNLIRTFIYSIPALLSLVCRKQIQDINNPVINISANMSIVAAGFYFLSSITSGIYIGRIPIFFSLYSYITLPWIINKCFTKEYSRLINVSMIIGYLGFYYYQMVLAWGLI